MNVDVIAIRGKIYFYYFDFTVIIQAKISVQ